MKCFQFPGILLFMGCLYLLGCDEKRPEPEAAYPGDPETAKIEGELSLMNFSKDSKSRNLTFGNNHALTSMTEAPEQTMQVHERIFYLGPAARNPRLLLVGKIRIEFCREIQDSSNDESPTEQSNDKNQNWDLSPE
jgi:hypothetical protein